MTFTESERAYLTAQPLGRLATLGPDGAPQVNPVAFRLNGDAIDIGGPALAGSRKYRNIQADPRISFVVDDNANHPVGPGGQRGRGLELRGRAELLDLDRPLLPGFTNEVIRLHAHRLVAWNLDGPGRNARNVP
ncbi:PPOX class F420-dependent oxidoreductase [Streptomyces sp. NPDC047081]|uniref:PPOX class F420-dependent oxidoreductase n=1 Tax=Streptomyces sp. NPDC047081 TaxID=3154706 RepID=UPI0033EE77CC